MIIKKNVLVLLSGIGLFLWMFPILSQAHSTTDNPLQYYDNQIKQAQQDALQRLTESMATETPNNTTPSSSQLPPTATQEVPAPYSNVDKAFAISPKARRQTPASSASEATAPQKNNPWLKPNPWAQQGQRNPWANAPIPGPTPPPSATSGFNPPPNIFAPPKARSAHQPADHG